MNKLSITEEYLLSNAMALGPGKKSPGLNFRDLSDKELLAAKRLVKKAMFVEVKDGFEPTEAGAVRAKSIY